MAFCGTNFQEEKKDEYFEEDSLNNVIAYSTTKGAASSICSEGLLHRKKDRRTQICYLKKKYHRVSYWALEHLTAEIPSSGFKQVGTCAGISVKSSKNLKLTCAHNVVGQSLRTKEFCEYKNIRTYLSRQGEHNYVAVRGGDQKTIRKHPGYDGYPNCGFDVAVFQAPEFLRKKYDSNSHIIDSNKTRDVLWAGVGHGSIKKGMSVEVAGFPGEKKGWPYTHTGKIKDITLTEQKGWLLWYDVDLTPGNSGSPIMITDKNFVKKFTSDPEIKKIVVGVHTGYDRIGNLNFGTLLTATILEWIMNEGKKTAVS